MQRCRRSITATSLLRTTMRNPHGTEDYALSERGEDHDILQDNASPEEEEEEEEEEKEEDEEEEEEEEEEKAEDDIWLIEEKASAASDDVEETLPPKWGPEGYHSKYHPVALMVSLHWISLLDRCRHDSIIFTHTYYTP